MNSTINIYFLFIIFFIYYLYDNKILNFDLVSIRDNKLKEKSNQEFFHNMNYNLDNKLYTLEVKTDKNIPILYTNFKYSLENKFGYELSQVFKIKLKKFNNLYDNLINLKNKPSLFLVSEIDYLNYTDKDNYRIVCSLYDLHFIVLSKINLNFDSWKDIKNYSDYYNNLSDTNKSKLPKILKIGIPTSSYNDAKRLFSFINIDIDSKDNKIKYKFIKGSSEKDLFNKMKLKGDNSIDLIYLTTSYKNPYLEEYLQSNDIHMFGTNGINKNLFNTIKGIYYKQLDNKKITNLVVEKNIYTSGNFKLSSGTKSLNIIGSIYSPSYATRLLLISHKDIDKKYIQYLLRNLYASADNIKYNMNKYLLNEERNNTINNLLDPYEMFLLCEERNKSANNLFGSNVKFDFNNKMKYHEGALNFYKEIHFLTSEEEINNNIYEKMDNKNLFSKLFITNN